MNPIFVPIITNVLLALTTFLLAYAHYLNRKS